MKLLKYSRNSNNNEDFDNYDVPIYNILNNNDYTKDETEFINNVTDNKISFLLLILNKLKIPLNKLFVNKLFGSVIIIRNGTTEAKEISSRKPHRFNKISK